MDNKPDELTTLSPYVDSPVLIERNLVLTDPNIINEYIDERFPHPQLMPPDPIMRARARLFLKDFENQLFIHMTDLEGTDTTKKNKAIKNITEGLLQLVPILNKQPYLLYDEYSMLDVAMAPLLWRLDHYGIKLPASAKPLMKYADSLFNRPLFDEAMTPAEKAMR
jgi:RNA polymerase-associated protein